MTILYGGNVGIGITAPSALLHVNGTGTLLNVTSGAMPILFANGSSVGVGTTTPGVKLTTQSANGYPAIGGSIQNGSLRVEGTTNSVMDFGSSGVSPYGNWIQSTDKSSLDLEYPLLLNPNGGNVGIGTSTPTHKLDV